MDNNTPFDNYKKYKKDKDNGVQDDYKAITGNTDEILGAYTQTVGNAYDAAKQQAADSAKTQKAVLPQQYRSSFDKNELQQLINERQLKERMDRLGLTNSGLNRSQQTALQLQRSNADQAVGQQKNAASSAITRQMLESQSALEQQKQQAIANAQYNLQAKKQDYLASLLSAAADRNANFANAYYNGELQRYSTDKTDAFNRYKVYTEDKYSRDKMDSDQKLSADLSDKEDLYKRYATDKDSEYKRYAADKEYAAKLLQIVAGTAAQGKELSASDLQNKLETLLNFLGGRGY